MVLSFIALGTYNNVCVKSEKIIGFDCIFDAEGQRGYEVFLEGGGHIDIRAGQYEYERLKEAMEEEENKEMEAAALAEQKDKEFAELLADFHRNAFGPLG